MQFEDLDKDTICKYALSPGLMEQAIFMTHPTLLVELMGDIGIAKQTADKMTESLTRADVAIITGAMAEDPAHDELIAAVRTAIASVELCFQTILDAVVMHNYTSTHCNCLPCQRRRQVKVAKNN